MTSVLIDSNVLLDIITEDAAWFDWSSKALERTADRSRLVINAIIYAEASIGYARIEDFDSAFPRSFADREPIPFEAAFLAGKAFIAYRARGGAKTRTLPDFMIGAHAAVAGHALLTRDPKVYRSYFPGVPLIAPDF